jgi:hypothetical protein
MQFSLMGAEYIAVCMPLFLPPHFTGVDPLTGKPSSGRVCPPPSHRCNLKNRFLIQPSLCRVGLCKDSRLRQSRPDLPR